MHNIQMRALCSLDILYFRFHNAFHFRVFLIVVTFAPLNVTSFICHFSTSLLWIGKLDERAFTFVSQLCNALWNSTFHGILECERERCVYSNSYNFLNSYWCSVYIWLVWCDFSSLELIKFKIIIIIHFVLCTCFDIMQIEWGKPKTNGKTWPHSRTLSLSSFFFLSYSNVRQKRAEWNEQKKIKYKIIPNEPKWLKISYVNLCDMPHNVICTGTGL